MSATDKTLVSYDNAAEIGFKIVEMADRVKVANLVSPGATASLDMRVSDTRFKITVALCHHDART